MNHQINWRTIRQSLCVLLSVLCLLALAACNSQPNAKVQDTPEITFEESKDLKVKATFIYDDDTYILFENTGEQPILNCELVYINFDNNGFSTTDDPDGYVKCHVDTINLMPGEKAMYSWYGATGNYASAVVTGIDYADGTTWEMTGIDLWAKKAISEFSTENQKEMLSKMSETSPLAETNEYVNLIDYSIEHGNRYSEKHDLHISLENTSDQVITLIDFFVLEFDKNGFPVSVSPYDTFCINGHYTGVEGNINMHESGSFTADLFISPSTKQVKLIVSDIKFIDDTEWVNPYLYEWIIANNKSY